MTKKIVVTGPESTGKSTLTEYLSTHYNAPMVQEYAREYLSNITRQYTLNDVVKMAKKQLELENSAALEANSMHLFLDTDLTVYKIWIKEKYNLEIDWINEELKKSTGKLYLLCNIDLPWEPDRLREHPCKQDRERIYSNYIRLLKEYNLNFHIISGNKKERLKNSINYIANQK